MAAQGLAAAQVPEAGMREAGTKMAPDITGRARIRGNAPARRSASPACDHPWAFPEAAIYRNATLAGEPPVAPGTSVGRPGFLGDPTPCHISSRERQWSSMSPAAPHNDAPHRGPPSRAAPARYQPLVVVLTAVAAGIFLDRYGRLPLGVWWGIAGSAAAAWLVLWRRGKSALSAAALLLAAGATAASWHHCRWHLCRGRRPGAVRPVSSPARLHRGDRPAARRGCCPGPALTPLRVVQPGNQVRCELALIGIRDGAQWRPAAGRSRMVVQGPAPGRRRPATGCGSSPRRPSRRGRRTRASSTPAGVPAGRAASAASFAPSSPSRCRLSSRAGSGTPGDASSRCAMHGNRLFDRMARPAPLGPGRRRVAGHPRADSSPSGSRPSCRRERFTCW